MRTLDPEPMGSGTQVTKQQPAASLKNKSVFLQSSLITFYNRRKRHMHKQEFFDIIFFVFGKLSVSDFCSTGQGCQQSHNAYQKVATYVLLSGLSLCEDHVSSAHRISLLLYNVLLFNMFVFLPFQEAK